MLGLIFKILFLIPLVLMIFGVCFLFSKTLRQRGAKILHRRFNSAPETAQPAVFDTIQCTVCNAYIPAKTAINCGKQGCPW
jgi:hypothetical protein